MEAFFKDNLIDYITVDGNAEGIYFALSEGDSTVMGMNKFICSTMKIGFEEEQVNTISIYEKPDAKFIPPHELTKTDMQLKGFSWRVEERPTLSDIFAKKGVLNVLNDSTAIAPMENDISETVKGLDRSKLEKASNPKPEFNPQRPILQGRPERPKLLKDVKKEASGNE